MESKNKLNIDFSCHRTMRLHPKLNHRSKGHHDGASCGVFFQEAKRLHPSVATTTHVILHDASSETPPHPPPLSHTHEWGENTR